MMTETEIRKAMFRIGVTQTVRLNGLAVLRSNIDTWIVIGAGTSQAFSSPYPAASYIAALTDAERDG